MSAAYAKSTCADDIFSSAHEQMGKMVTELRSTEMLSAQHGEVESFVREQGRELERLLYQAHLDLRAGREHRVPVRGADEVERTYPRPSGRPLGTILGRVVVARLAYQAPGVEGLHPMDAALNLPPELYSHGVSRFVADHAARMSFDEVVGELLTATGTAVGKRQVEEVTVRAAVDFEAFYEQHRAANDVVEPTRDLLVMTFDGKGIVMVHDDLHPATKKAARTKARKLTTRLTSGEKRNRKRMAEVAAIYTVGRHVRTPFDVLADLYGDLRRASDAVTPRRPEGSGCYLGLLLFHHANPGEPTPALPARPSSSSIPSDSGGRLHAFYGEGTKEGEAWVQRRLLWLLHGRPAGKVATNMRQLARAAGLGESKLAAVRDTADYLQEYARYMRYGDALQWGLPIATGVIEGACRYLVKDRMDRGGARWTLDGAEAVLRLRALRASGDFEDYWAFHLREELRRNHTAHYADGRLPDPLRPLRRVK